MRRLFAACWSFLCSLLKRKCQNSAAVVHILNPPLFFLHPWVCDDPVAARNLFNNSRNLRKIRIYRVALLPKIEVCFSEILHEDLAFQRLDCKHFKFIWLYGNRETCPSLMYKNLLTHSERLCPSGRGRDTQRGVYFQCSLHDALSDPVSATASSRSPPFLGKNPSPLTVVLHPQQQ